MKVSVIIPFNKGDDYLRDCLDSLCEQEYKDYEVLLVNDGYVGDIDELTSPYKERLNLRILKPEDGKPGVAAARNAGLDAAVGEFVYFLDSDDYIFEEAIGTLVEAADETDEDLVYGRKHYTYYRRGVFVPMYIEKREALLAQKLEEAAQLGTDEDEEDEVGVDDEMLLDEDYLREQAILHDQKAFKRAVKLLIRKKKRLRNISILHILIRRKVIEDKHLRFDDTLKYYSDAPFLVALLNDETLHVRKRFASHYVKRSHQDIVNHPALTQIVDVNRFDELIRVFYRLLEITDPEGLARSACEYQIVSYATGYFLKKVKRSEGDKWRTTRFDAMARLIAALPPERLKKGKFWKRRALKAILAGDVKKSTKIITRHLAFYKLRKLLKGRKKVLTRHMYVRYLKNKPISENTILFETFFGKSYSDSPKYIYEYIAQNYPGHYNLVWVLNKRRKLPYGGKIVKRSSIRYYYYLATSKYFVFNVKQMEWFKKRDGTVFFETWHGTPLKRLGFDIKDVFGAAPDNKKKLSKATKNWDYLLSPNSFSSECFHTCFLYDKKQILEYGYPRNDILHSEAGALLAPQIKRKLHIPLDKKLILYAPTWRDDEFYGHGRYKFELKLDLDLMRRELGDEYVVLLRTHYFIADSVDTAAYEGFAFNVSRYDDIAELYLISDILITDYSSVFFDFGGLKRPMLFYTYDLEKYRDVLHGFYMNMEEEVPGPMLFTTGEVVEALKNIEKIKAEYADKYESFYNKYCSLEDGHAAERCAKKLLGK